MGSEVISITDLSGPAPQPGHAPEGADTENDRNAPATLGFRQPKAEDGPEITRLIQSCPPLDTNSAYCNLLQCTHFAETCVVAERSGRIVGWVSGYRPPSTPDRIFVWQVAVHPDARGLGLGQKLLGALLERPAVQGATHLITTITDNNDASWGLFTGFARKRGLNVSRTPFFERETHFAGAHDTEHLVSIGPFPTNHELKRKEDA